MSETWADRAEREMRAGHLRRLAESAKTWAEGAELEMQAEWLERGTAREDEGRAR